MKYLIVESTRLESLVLRVQEQLDLGWRPFGSPNRTEQGQWYQAIVKETSSYCNTGPE